MQEVLLVIFIIMMLVATVGHVLQLIRRKRHLRIMYRAMAEAGKKKE